MRFLRKNRVRFLMPETRRVGIRTGQSVLNSRHQISIYLILLAGMMLTSGCTLSRKYINRDLSFPENHYQIGVTHRNEVLDELGPPLKITKLPDGYAFMYEGLDTQELQLGFSLPVPVINWFKFVIARADYDHLVLVYLFDQKHRLVAKAGDDTHFDLGSSTAVQPVLAVEMLFDTSAVENEVVNFIEWPTFCLRPLPETLNRHNTMNTGTDGFEQRGTATVVGQRALEMHKQ